MCGITFILSKNKINIIENLLNSLELIQNRGYDSMGVCYFDNSSNNYNITEEYAYPGVKIPEVILRRNKPKKEKLS